ncbi:MAG TPA: hypothetical protein DDY76_02245, partial [Opitutae bacterium]|nr:hypothetical protein [Opitutae bacterium]
MGAEDGSLSAIPKKLQARGSVKILQSDNVVQRRGITQTLQSQVKVGSGDLVEMKIFESLVILHVR